MKFVAALLTGFALIALAPVVGAQSREKQRTFIETPDHDPEMDAAIAKAKSELAYFWTVFESPSQGERSFAVKRKFTEGSNWEYMWVTPLRRKNGRLTGRVANEPDGLRNVKLGQIVTFDESEIADWLYMRAGKMHGNHTVRPLLQRMAPPEAAKMRAMLAEP